MNPCPHCGKESYEEVCPWCGRDRRDSEAGKWHEFLTVVGGLTALLGVSLALWIAMKPRESVMQHREGRDERVARRAAAQMPAIVATGATPTANPAPKRIAVRTVAAPVTRPTQPPKVVAAAVQGLELVEARLNRVDDGSGAPYLAGTVTLKNGLDAPVDSINLTVEAGDRSYRLQITGSANVPAGGTGQLQVRTIQSFPKSRRAKAVLLTATQTKSGQPISDSLPL